MQSASEHSAGFSAHIHAQSAPVLSEFSLSASPKPSFDSDAELIAAARGTARLLKALVPSSSLDCLYIGETRGEVSPELIRGLSEGWPGVRTHLGSIQAQISQANREIRPYFEAIGKSPREVVSRLLNFELKGDVSIEFSGCALCLRLDEADYEALSQKRKWSAPDCVSLATTLSTNEIPEALRGRLIVINGRNSNHTHLSDDKILASEQHEILHAIFNACFRVTDLPTFDVMKAQLDKILEPGNAFAHNHVAAWLSEAMGEAARSEIIAYFSGGQFDISAKDLYETWWQDFHIMASEYVTRNVPSLVDKQMVTAVYMNRRHTYDLQVENYKRLAQELYESDTNPPLSREEKTALLMHITLENADRLKNFLTRYSTDFKDLTIAG